MEQIPNFRVVGRIEEDDKKLIAERRLSLLYEKHLANMDKATRNELDENELPKTEEELRFIELANDQTNELLKLASIEPYDVPERNFHKIKQELYKKYKSETTAGFFEERYQMILLNANIVPSNRLYKALVIFHELLHMKSYLAYHASAEEEDGRKILHTTKYREGVDVRSAPMKELTGDEHEHFYGLNEAIVSYEEKIYLQKLMQTPLFTEEKQNLLSSEIEPAKEHLVKEQGIPEDELVAIDTSENYYLSIGYQAQRKVLDYVCEQIAQDTNRSVEDIHGEFLKSQLSGKLVFLAKLVENSFGEKSFAELGKLTSKNEDAIAVLDSLKSMRSVLS